MPNFFLRAAWALEQVQPARVRDVGGVKWWKCHKFHCHTLESEMEDGSSRLGAPLQMRPHVEGPWAGRMQMATRRRPLQLHLHLHHQLQLQLQLRLERTATFRTIFHAKHAFAIRFDLDQCAAWSRPLKSIEKTRMFWESLSPCPGKGDELRMWTSWVACVATGKWSVWEKCWDNLRFVMLEWPLTFGLAGNAFPGFFAYENPTSNGRKSIELNP